jgi:hypothetical protein
METREKVWLKRVSGSLGVAPDHLQCSECDEVFPAIDNRPLAVLAIFNIHAQFRHPEMIPIENRKAFRPQPPKKRE